MGQGNSYEINPNCKNDKANNTEQTDESVPKRDKKNEEMAKEIEFLLKPSEETLNSLHFIERCKRMKQLLLVEIHH